MIPYFPQCATFAFSFFFYEKTEFVINSDNIRHQPCPCDPSFYAFYLYDDHRSCSFSVCASCVPQPSHSLPTSRKSIVIDVFALSFLLIYRENETAATCVSGSFLSI
jgi:hypothetical protein